MKKDIFSIFVFYKKKKKQFAYIFMHCKIALPIAHSCVFLQISTNSPSPLLSSVFFHKKSKLAAWRYPRRIIQWMHSAYDSHVVKRNARKVCASRRIHANVCQLLANCWGSDDNSRWMFLLQNLVSSTRCMNGTKRVSPLIVRCEGAGRSSPVMPEITPFRKYVCNKFRCMKSWLKSPNGEKFKSRAKLDYIV